jgi:PHD/YefM family antitoxin component YafN of YafNO toxin-antitoxin module
MHMCDLRSLIPEVCAVPTIRPSSDLRNNYNEISTFCHANAEPVYITKNGRGDLAVLSIEAYEKLVGRFELRRLLAEGIDDIENGRKTPVEDAFTKIRQGLKK